MKSANLSNRIGIAEDEAMGVLYSLSGAQRPLLVPICAADNLSVRLIGQRKPTKKGAKTSCKISCQAAEPRDQEGPKAYSAVGWAVQAVILIAYRRNPHPVPAGCCHH
jgi:hypothetical protein